MVNIVKPYLQITPTVMSELNIIKELLSAPTEMTDMIAYKRKEERARLGSELSDKPIDDFEIFNGIKGNKFLQDRFISMQDVYIFDENDKMTFQEAAASLSEIQRSLLNEIAY